MKKLGTMALAFALSASLAAPSLAAETGLLISPGPGGEAETVTAPAPGGYHTVLILNGETLDASGVPAASPDMLPLRLLAESDHGSASWFEEENQGYFYLGEARVTVNFADNSIQVNDIAVEGLAEVVNGVTFIPAGVLGAIEGFAVHTNPELDVDRIDITTPNNAPLVKLAYSIIDASGMGIGMRADNALLQDNYHIPLESFEEIVAFIPMMTSPDTVIVGKLSEGADLDAVKAALEAYRQTQEDTFSWYLSQNLPKVEDARTVTAGGYILFLIAQDADKGVEAFEAFVAAQAE